MSDPPVPPSRLRRDIPSGLEAAILRCLEKDPGRRFQSAEELSAAIAPFAAIRPVMASRPDSDGSDEIATIALARPFKVPQQNSARPMMMAGGGTVPIPRELVASLGLSPLPAAPPPPAAPQEPVKKNPWLTTLPMDMAPMPAPGPESAAPRAAPESAAPARVEARPAIRGSAGQRWLLVGVLASMVLLGAAVAWLLMSRHGRPEAPPQGVVGASSGADFVLTGDATRTEAFDFGKS